MKLISLILVFFIIGCGRPPRVGVPTSKVLREKTILMRKKRIREMQKIEKTQLREFNKDVKILKKTNPFSPSAIVSAVTPPFNLTGIIWDENSPTAIVNDMIVSEGDMIGNKKVKKITENSVILIEDGREHILRLKF